MTNVTIRSSRPRGSGWLIGVAVLVIYAFARTGPFMGPDRPRVTRQDIQQFMDKTGKAEEIEKMRRFLDQFRKERESEMPQPSPAIETPDPSIPAPPKPAS